MSSEFEQELRRLVDAIKQVRGVTYIALYGSYARGDYEEGSDVDLLILFEDKESMKMGRDEIFRRAGESKMFLQLTIFTLQEFFNECNPVFVRSVMNEGRMLLQREPEEMQGYLRRFRKRYPELVLKK